MPGLVTGIHAVGRSAGLAGRVQTSVQYLRAFVQPNRVDDRDKPGHDGEGGGALCRPYPSAYGSATLPTGRPDPLRSHRQRQGGEVARAALDRIFHLFAEVVLEQAKFDGDSGEADLPVHARKQAAAARRRLECGRLGVNFVTHDANTLRWRAVRPKALPSDAMKLT